MNDQRDGSESARIGESQLVDRVAKLHQSAPGGLAVRLDRVWNILRYYGKPQLARRAFAVAGKRLGIDSKSRSAGALSNSIPLASTSLRAQSAFESICATRVMTAHGDRQAICEQLACGEISVMNQRRPLSWRLVNDGSQDQRLDRDVETTLIWQFQLHYHEYLIPLIGESPNPRDLELIEQTLVSWLDENSISDPAAHVDAWHPYCISRRLPVWFCLLTMPELNESIRARMLSSAQLQAEFLSRNLEWDLRGNHLLENLRALALAGCYFDSEQSNQWLALVRKVLPKQLKQQILPHGEHYERCPMYHCQMFGNLLETLIVTERVDPKLHEMIRPTTEKMFQFLVEIVHPDGEIPLLGDSCFGEAPNVRCLESLAELASLECPIPPEQPENVSTIGDYWILRNDNDYVLFDRGAAGATTLPAHAHCDLLTLESSLGGVRWLVDSGLYGYDDNPMRWYCRSSPAHNVVCVDSKNQFDIWSIFRMGRRAWTRDLSNGQEHDFSWATASHNGYRHLGVPRLSRLLGAQNDQFWYCLDRAETTPNSKRTLTGFLHLSPDVTASMKGERQIQIEFSDRRYPLMFSNVSNLQIIDGWYCPEFGVRVRNQVIEYTIEPDAPLGGWVLVPRAMQHNANDPALGLQSHRVPGADKISISTPANGIIHTFNWNTHS